jgi:hypothetical protein
MNVGIRYGSAVQNIKLIAVTIANRIAMFFAWDGNDFNPMRTVFLNQRKRVSVSTAFGLKNTGGDTGWTFGGKVGTLGFKGMITLIICPPLFDIIIIEKTSGEMTRNHLSMTKS